MTVSDQGSLLEGMNRQCHNKMSSLRGILQARMLEWVAIPFFRGSFQPRDQTQVSCIVGGFFKVWATREAPKYLSSQHTHFSSRPTVLVGFIYMRALLPHGIYRRVYTGGHSSAPWGSVEQPFWCSLCGSLLFSYWHILAAILFLLGGLALTLLDNSLWPFACVLLCNLQIFNSWGRGSTHLGW